MPKGWFAVGFKVSNMALDKKIVKKGQNARSTQVGIATFTDPWMVNFDGKS